MPKLREELQFTSLDEREIIRPKEGVSLYYKNGVMKILHANGDEQTLLAGEDVNIDLSQYYTKIEVDTLLEELGPTGFEVIEVASLPTVGDPGKLYITPDTDGSYLEYLYVKGKWELVGGMKVDLSNYYTKAEVEKKISDLVGSAPETLNTLQEIAAALEGQDDVITALETSIGSKANSADVYTKTEVDNKLDNLDIPETDLKDYALKSELPTHLSDLVDDIGHATPGDLESLETSILNSVYTKEQVTNLLSTKANTDDLSSKQDTLVSGTNIKTINGSSILGSGNIEIEASSGGSTVIPNPELDGGEEILESIQIEDTKFSLQGQDMTFSESLATSEDAKTLKTITIGTDEWRVDKGSVVRPNVELTGEEPVLESVQIDDATFTLKGEEMIFSETPVEGAIILRNIKLGDENWAIPEGGTGGSSTIIFRDWTV